MLPCKWGKEGWDPKIENFTVSLTKAKSQVQTFWDPDKACRLLHVYTHNLPMSLCSYLGVNSSGILDPKNTQPGSSEAKDCEAMENPWAWPPKRLKTLTFPCWGMYPLASNFISLNLNEDSPKYFNWRKVMFLTFQGSLKSVNMRLLAR